MDKKCRAHVRLYLRIVALAAGSFFLISCDWQLPPKTKIVYLAPSMPCENGEPGFDESNCLAWRKRDAVAMLRVPSHFGGPTNLEAPKGLSGAVVLMPDKVLTMDDADFVAKEKIGIRNLPKFDPEGPTYIGLLTAAWGWSSSSREGHELARTQMKLASESSANGQYIEIKPYFKGFQTYGEQQCVGQFKRLEQKKGQVTPASACDWRTHFLLPADRTDIFVSCSVPEYQDGKLIEGRGCMVSSSFELRNVDSKPFYVRFTYTAEPNWLQEGHWKYIDKRLRDWIKSMDVSDQQSLRGK